MIRLKEVLQVQSINVIYVLCILTEEKFNQAIGSRKICSDPLSSKYVLVDS